MPSFPAAQPLRIDPDGSIPSIAVHIGQIQFGSYLIGLWTRQGRAFGVGSGDTGADETTTSLSRTHRIVRTRAQLAQIDGFHLTIVVNIQVFSRKAGARWSYGWTIEQDGTTLAEEAKSGAVTRQMLTEKKLYKITLAGSPV